MALACLTGLPMVKPSSCYEIDGSLFGCSGFVTFEMGGTEDTIAFSNPLLAPNI